VAEQTGGNPFFMTELVRLLMTDRQRQPGSAATVPGSVREAVARHVQLLSPACQTLLPVAAVFGREFELPALAHAFARDRAKLLDAIDEAATCLIEPGPRDGALPVTHALVRETLYDTPSSRERTRLHARAGDAVAAVHADRRSVSDRLAHHYGQAAMAGDATVAIDYAVRRPACGRQWAYETPSPSRTRVELRERNLPRAAGRWPRGAAAPRATRCCRAGRQPLEAGDFTRAKGDVRARPQIARRQRSATTGRARRRLRRRFPRLRSRRHRTDPDRSPRRSPALPRVPTPAGTGHGAPPWPSTTFRTPSIGARRSVARRSPSRSAAPTPRRIWPPCTAAIGRSGGRTISTIACRRRAP
jgi:hypothetical protein